MSGAEDGAPAFGRLLRGHRLEAGLTQDALAERAGLSRRGIQHLEAGEARPYRDTVRRLAGALELAPEVRAAFEAAAGPAPRRRGEDRLSGVRRLDVPAAYRSSSPRPELAGEAARVADAASTAAGHERRSVPASPHLVHQALAPRGTPAAERKLVTVLCAGVTGAEAPLESLDPEEAHALLGGVREAMFGAVLRYGGAVNQVLGGGITALFGAPLAQEDHALRACHAALALQEDVRRYGEETRPRAAGGLQLRVGLSTGEVVVRGAASDAWTTYPAVGPAVHLAARIEQLAPPDTCLLAPETLRLVEDLVRVRPLGAFTVDGLTASVEVYQLVGAERSPARLPAAAARGLTPLVGRRIELETLHRALEQAGRGRGQVVALVGEPGVGKSRLVWELTRGPKAHGWRVLETHAVSHGRAIAYLSVIDLLRTYCGIEPRDDGRTIREKLLRTVLGLDEALRPSVPALLGLLNAPVDDPNWLALDPPQRRRLTLDALKRVLLRESRVQPLLLVFEDLHWIDAETQALLDGLADSLPTARLLLLVTYRPEYTHTWGSKTYYTQLRVDPLPPERADEVLDWLLGDDSSVEDLKPLLVDRTEGNPFFLEESVRALLELGALVGERGSCRLARPVATVAMPPTVQAILAARIDRLAPEDKRLLQIASVIGKDVPFPLLGAVAGLPEDVLQRGLARLQAAEFVYEAALFPEPEYTFKHALTHEVAYGTLLRERRRALHTRILEAIERLHPDRLAEHVERLAHHALRGEVWDKALAYCREAGTKAIARSANREAVAHFEQALQALQHLPEGPSTREQAIDVRIDLRQALSPLGEMAQVVEHLREAERLAESLDDRPRLSRVASLMIACFWWERDYDRAMDTGRRALAIAESAGDFAGQVVANYHLGLRYRELGAYSQAVDALKWTVAALQGERMRERFGLGDFPAVGARGGLTWCLAELGDFAEGAAYGEEAIRIAERLNHPYSLGIACFDLGGLYLRQGHTAEAVAVLERGLDQYRTWDLRGLFSTLASRLGAAYTLAGRLVESLDLLEEVEQRARVGGSVPEGSLHTVWLGEAYLAAGRRDDATQLARRALDHSMSGKNPGLRGWALRLLGEIAAGREPPDADQAEGHCRQALALAEELGMRPLLAHCRLALGKLYRRTGRTDEARAELSAAVELYRAMEMTFWLPGAEADLAELTAV